MIINVVFRISDDNKFKYMRMRKPLFDYIFDCFPLFQMRNIRLANKFTVMI